MKSHPPKRCDHFLTDCKPVAVEISPLFLPTLTMEYGRACIHWFNLNCSVMNQVIATDGSHTLVQQTVGCVAVCNSIVVAGK